MKLFTTTATILSAITDISVTGKKLDQMIQVAAVSCIDHLGKHGDITLTNKLVEAMPNGSRVNALRDYLGTFGKMVYNEDTKEFDYSKEAKTDVAGAMQIMWTEFKPEQPYVAFDLRGMMLAVLKKADTALSNEKQKGNVDCDLLATLRGLVDTPEEAEVLMITKA